ncbi:MAG: cobalamin biosynthesis protein CobW [Streptosporangiales bacterium]|nr:cobalamin biosynthesis protein CobW [Streptosporangiales bacterium]
MRQVPVVVVAAVDPVLRDAVSFCATCESPDVVVLSHDLTRAAATGEMRRTAYSAAGLVEDEVVHLDHPCLTCALREDIVPSLRRLARSGRWRGIVLALPLATDPSVAVGGIASAGDATVVACVLGVVDAATLLDDVFGDDLLADRGLHLATTDRRSVGETLAGQLDHADVVAAVLSPGAGPGSVDVIAHLAGDRMTVSAGVESYDVGALFRRRHDPAVAAARIDPRRVHPRVRPAAPGEATRPPWTLDLRSDRPLHPDRLRTNLSALAMGRLRGRGRFWLPTRPGSVCQWDGAGGQLSIGTAGGWGGTAPSTRLVITGLDDAVPVRAAFADCVLTDTEVARGQRYWSATDDGFEPWLGERSDAA